MSKVNVKVLGAVVDGHTAGSTLEIDERAANQLAAIGYVEILAAQKSEGEKGESAPKKSSGRKRNKE